MDWLRQDSKTARGPRLDSGSTPDISTAPVCFPGGRVLSALDVSVGPARLRKPILNQTGTKFADNQTTRQQLKTSQARTLRLKDDWDRAKAGRVPIPRTCSGVPACSVVVGECSRLKVQHTRKGVGIS